MQFAKKWNGKRCDFDNAFGAQCVDLFRMYCKEVWNVPQLPPVQGAKDFVKHVEKEVTPMFLTNYISIGDVVVYGDTPKNPYGHICIVLQVVDDESLIVLEQDGFRQDGVKIVLRERKNIIGIISVL